MAESFGSALLGVLYLFFLLAMVIVGLVFLTDNIADNKALIPGFNNTMYQFLYVGLWIVVAVTAVQFLVAIFAVGVIINRMPPPIITSGEIELYEPRFVKTKVSAQSRRALAKRAERRAASR